MQPRRVIPMPTLPRVMSGRARGRRHAQPRRWRGAAAARRRDEVAPEAQARGEQAPAPHLRVPRATRPRLRDRDSHHRRRDGVRQDGADPRVRHVAGFRRRLAVAVPTQARGAVRRTPRGERQVELGRLVGYAIPFRGRLLPRAASQVSHGRHVAPRAMTDATLSRYGVVMIRRGAEQLAH